MPKKSQLGYFDKARIVANKLRTIDWSTINSHKGAGAEERVKIIRNFLKDCNIPHRSIFTIKKKTTGWSASTEFDLKIHNNPEESETYSRAREELIIPVTKMLKTLFPDSRNKSCGLCKSRILHWTGFCPDYEVCQCSSKGTTQ